MAGWTPPTRYDSSALVASGGMGDVYRVVDLSLERTVALKVLAERHSQSSDIRARFTREAHAAARLSTHPHVVTVFDVGEHDGRPFIVMEYLEGGSVHDRIRSAPVAPARAIGWLRQAAAGLDAAHAEGIVHRDVKPANLLLDDDDRVHVTDFGIASAAGFDTLTLPGTVLGTAGYLSPEQARGETASAASDRYALGVVAFELLTGRRPYAAETPVTEAFAHLNAPIPSAAETAPALPRGVDAVFERALAKDPNVRPASAGELVEELEDVLRGSEPVTAVIPPAAEPMRVSRHGGRRRVRWLAPLAFAALLLGGLTAAAFVSNDGEPNVSTITRVTTSVSTETATVSESTTPETEPEFGGMSGAELDAEGFERMQAGDYTGALPYFEEAVSLLAGSGSLAEAYASYNLAFTRFALGQCDGVLELLDRSEEVQGERSEIKRLRRDAERQCGDEDPGRGKGKGGEGGDD
ncbi:MAG: serine/threonine-protein kinase [Gaiellaceae bacterium]